MASVAAKKCSPVEYFRRFRYTAVGFLTLTTTLPQQPKHGVVTLKDIAEHCGVTVATVSRALRDPERHSKDTTERIMQAAAELGYDPLHHQGARRLALSRFGKHLVNHLIAVIFPPYFYRANYFAEILQDCWTCSRPRGSAC